MFLHDKKVVFVYGIVLAMGWGFPAFCQQPNNVDVSYRVPSDALTAIVDASSLPGVSISPDRNQLLMMERRSRPSIEELSVAELRIAGLRLNPATNGPGRILLNRSLTLVDVRTKIQSEIDGLPDDAKIGHVSWSPDGLNIAFTLTRIDGIELWVANAAARSARRLMSGHVNAMFGSPYQWSPDSARLVVKVIPSDRGTSPSKPLVPPGPIIQQSSGTAAAARTYQDLLKDTHDKALFEYHGQSQLTLVDLSGKTTKLGDAAVFRSATPSPDGDYFLVQTIRKPYSYLVPYYRFPNRIEVWNTTGRVVRRIADLPLAESVPIGRGAVPAGVRSIQWRADSDATLFWVEAQDGGDPRAEAEIRDAVYLLDAPFNGDATLLLSLSLRYAGVQWGSDEIALINESWWANRKTRTWRVRPSAPEADATLIFDRSYEDRYGDPGQPVMEQDPRGSSRLLLTGDRKSLFFSGTGASPEGDRPFLDRYNLETGDTTRLWRSQSPYYERFVAFVDEKSGKVLTSRETKTEPPNFFIRDLSSDELDQITNFDHPYPQLASTTKEVIRYKRDDGVMLTATLYLPPGKTAEDGPFPMLFWAYPREFKNAEAAGQMQGSPHRFKWISPTGPLAFLASGYAILDGPTMPIIGEGDVEPNDTFIEQLVASASAAVDEVIRRGVAERNRIAIGGHSYGAFMTANLLAHSDLFATGIARSGAYNRSLTPFGFQAEERTFWEDPDVYFRMSPFMHADLINEPILLIHGEADNNSGTFPLQSRRFFSALKGHGADARLVMLPNESHGYAARESILHMLWEMDDWLDKYIGNAREER